VGVGVAAAVAVAVGVAVGIAVGVGVEVLGVQRQRVGPALAVGGDVQADPLGQPLVAQVGREGVVPGAQVHGNVPARRQRGGQVVGDHVVARAGVHGDGGDGVGEGERLAVGHDGDAAGRAGVGDGDRVGGGVPGDLQDPGPGDQGGRRARQAALVEGFEAGDDRLPEVENGIVPAASSW